jgi:uncharacterized protein
MTPAPPAFHVMAKPRGAVCNLACAYCFYLPKEGLYPGSGSRMSNEVLERFVRQHIEAHRVPDVTFTWQGGEPTLMGLGFFKRAVDLQNRFRRPGTRIHNAIQTNATLLDDEWCRFFRENGFLVGASLDGPRAIHDAHRADRGGAPTFDRVVAGIALLREHRVDFNVLACVHAASAGRGLEVYRFLRDDARSPMIQFIPVVERDGGGRGVTARSITGRQYGEFLIEVFNEWVRRDVGGVFVQIFDVSLGAWLGLPPALCVFAETCGDALALEHNGDLYSCDHFVEPRHKLGNIAQAPLAEFVASEQQRKFGLDKREALPRLCRECPVRFACNGGCPKDRFLTTPDGEPGLNFLCEGLRAFFTHVDGPMRTMAGLVRRRRPPAEIMSLNPTSE